MWFEYWKHINESDLYYLFKIVHNRTIYEEEEKNVKNEEFNKFCLFVFELSRTKKEDNISDPHNKEDDIYYIYYFLKDYDMDLFKNLTFFQLKKYLLNCSKN